MQFNDYVNSLRVNLLNDKFYDNRLEMLIKYCKKYGYNDVMFYTNSTEMQITHPTIEELSHEVEGLKKAAAILRKKGFTVSLNPITTIGQGDKYNGLRGKHTFHTLVGASGAVSSSVACPLDEEFIDYISGVYRYLAGELRPEIIWIEDDFRMNNRPTLGWGGCFCELHMKEYAKELGFEVTREEFVAKLLEEGKCNTEYRKAYAYVTRRAMENLARAIGNAVHEASPESRVGFMTSVPEEHAVEYRDWERLFNSADTRGGIDRVTLPAYDQIRPQEYCWLFNKWSVQTKARVPEDTIILPELENAPHSPYSKSVGFTRMETETAQVMGTHGITINTEGQNSNGIVPAWGYGEMLKKDYPYLNAVRHLDLDFSSLKGVIVPFSDESVLTMKPTKYCDYLDHIKPDDNHFAGVLPCWGIAYKYMKDPIDVKGEVVALSGQWLRNFDEKQIKEFFANNFVILNAEAVETLVDMGLGYLANIKSVKWLNSGAEDHVTADVAVDDYKVYGMDRFVVVQYNGALDVEYIDEKKIVKQYSVLCGDRGQEIAKGMVLGEKTFIFPFEGERYNVRRLHPLREEAFKDVLQRIGNPAFYTKGRCCSAYYYAKNNVLGLANFFDDDAPIEFVVPKGFSFEKMRIVGRNGKMQDVSWTRKGDCVKTKRKVKAYSTAFLKFD